MNATVRTLTSAAALTFVALTTMACGSAQQAGPATPPGPTTQQRDQVQNTAQDTKGQPRYDRCGWRDETKFVQILGWEFRGPGEDAVLYLREAEKHHLGESFETKQLDDKPFCHAYIRKDAPVLTLDRETSTPEKLITTLADGPLSLRDEGFDVTFESDTIAKVQWLSAPGTADQDEDTSSGDPKCAWRDETKFVQIVGRMTSGDTAVLYLREAKKKPLGESFETETLHDKQTCEVPLPETARIERLRQGTSTRAAFLQDLAKLNSSQRKEGFDITFDRQAHIAKVNWLFAPAS